MGFSFGTKAETLESLKPFFKKACFCDQVYFTVREWKEKRERLIEAILGRFDGNSLAVRSSAQGEDGFDSSMAGAYSSVIGVKPEGTALISGVEEVTASYKTENGKNHVLVQPVVENVVIAGVVLTRDLDTGSPYYTINYDDSTGRTDTVTSGEAENKTMLIHRSHPKALRSRRFRKLIDIVVEIESITGCCELDIEFCITDSEDVYILQVRPITSKNRWESIPDETLNREIDRIYSQLDGMMRPQKGLAGSTTILGEMPDWNPAEMIGNTPKPLALSLYKYLITDWAWLEARRRMGYRKLETLPLLVDFHGRPYIDVRRSLNSFLPDGLSDDVADRLIEHQLEFLADNQEYHDKIEFEIAITCRDFAFDLRAERLRAVGFREEDIRTFGQHIWQVTRDNVVEGKRLVRELLATTEQLKILHSQAQDHDPNRKVKRLLDDCIVYGTLPFSQLARHGFIGASFLRSMVTRDAISREEADGFMLSIHTVAEDIVNDMYELSCDGMDLEAFLALYGHLRPGTYDILSWRYDEVPDLYLGKVERPPAKAHAFALDGISRKAVMSLLDEEGFEISPEELFEYISMSVMGREQAKFEFTRNISDALVEISRWGETLGLSREDLAFLEIERILECEDAGALKEQVAAARERYHVTRAICLPHLITAPEDCHVVRMPLGHPTYITSKAVTGTTQFLQVNQPADIEDRIVLIEGADPGYDWIFSRRINGLITKYGGANSHMAIRCAEFGLPAAIGCGERLFNDVLNMGILELNCAARSIKAIGG